MFAAVLERLNSLFTNEQEASNDQHERKQIKLLPLEKFSVPFVRISDWEQRNKPESHRGSLRRLSDFKAKYEKKLRDHEKAMPKPIDVSSFQVRTREQRKNLVLIHYYNAKRAKIFDLQLQNLHEALALIENMTRFLSNVAENQYPLSFDVDGFCNAILKKTTEIPGVPHIEMKIQILKSQINPSPTEEKVTKQQVKDALTEALPFFDSSRGFIPSTKFEDVFRDYLKDTGRDEGDFNEMLTLLSNFEYSRALTKLSDTVKSLGQELSLSERGVEYLILYIASSRFLFDEVSIQLPSMLRNDLSAGAFVKHCETLRNSSPMCMKAEKLFTPDQREKTITEIFMDSEELRQALSFIQTIQFYSCPLDIAFVTTQATQIIDVVIHKTRYRNKRCGGDPNAEVPQEYLLTAEMNDFDSVFTYLVMAFCVDPPANATAIATYMNALSSESLLNDFEYARSLIISSVEFLREHELPVK